MITVVFDLETGGLEMHHPIIQLAGIAFDEFGRCQGEFERKVLFNEPDADPEALRLVGYKREVWDDRGVALPVALGDFAKWLEPYRCIKCISKQGQPYKVARLAAYNAQFDAPRLQKAFKATGIYLPAEPRVLCIMQLAMWSEWPGSESLGSFKLGEIARRMGVDTSGAHDALADCKMAAEVMFRYAGVVGVSQ